MVLPVERLCGDVRITTAPVHRHLSDRDKYRYITAVSMYRCVEDPQWIQTFYRGYGDPMVVELQTATTQKVPVQ